MTASSFATLTSVLDQLSVPSESGRPGAGLYGTPSCLYAAGFDPAGSDLGNIRATMSRPDALLKCLGDRPVGYRALIATAVLLAVAALVYWWMPKARDWRRRMVPVEAVDADGTLRAELAALCGRTGVRSGLRFRVDPARMASGASAYGRTGNYTVCLHAGLLARRGTDPEGFRAVVLHELAHVHHRDVDYAYASTALWRVYVLLALLPHFAGIGWIFLLAFSGTDSPWWPGAAPALLAEVFVGLLLTALLHLARADLLRRRELHADLQAVAWGAHPGSWDRSDPAGAVAPALRRLTALLRTHPSWAERRGVLADAGRGFRVSPLEMFLTGASASLLYSALGLTSSALLPETVGWSYALGATVAVVTPVLCAGLGLPLVRASDPARGYVRSTAVSGLWLGCGLLVGEVTASGQYRLDVLVSQPEYLLAFLFIGAVPALWWSHSLRLALGLPRRGQRWAAAVVCALVTAAVLLTGLLWWRLGGERIAMGYGDAGEGLAAMYARMVPGNWRDYGLDLSTLTVGMPLLTPLSEERLADATAFLMWFVPLVLLLVRGPGLRMRRTLGAGVVGGLVSWAGLAAAMYAMYLQRPATLKERAGPFLVVHTWWMVVTVLAACGLTAALVAAYSRRHWLLRALIAAQITQLMAYAGVFVLYSADGCLGPLNTVLDACQWRPHNGLTVDKGVTHLTLAGGVGPARGPGAHRVPPAALGTPHHGHAPCARCSRPVADRRDDPADGLLVLVRRGRLLGGHGGRGRQEAGPALAGAGGQAPHMAGLVVDVPRRDAARAADRDRLGITGPPDPAALGPEQGRERAGPGGREAVPRPLRHAGQAGRGGSGLLPGSRPGPADVVVRHAEPTAAGGPEVPAGDGSARGRDPQGRRTTRGTLHHLPERDRQGDAQSLHHASGHHEGCHVDDHQGGTRRARRVIGVDVNGTGRRHIRPVASGGVRGLRAFRPVSHHCAKAITNERHDWRWSRRMLLRDTW
ncbi:M48 family metalloprotease [Streptomyces sp. 769]|uniref:M48 family metalloprotease n=1 Tax=Streptomyces sp. 769 TaxID=1262452 RepID=UPI00068E91A6|nr:M48 family metalloprotease [Streptomyces sp. 769]